jgi:hypothetical protein
MATEKKTEKKIEKKTDEQILFPEAKIGDIVIKPWSFGVLFEISDLLDQVITKTEEKGILLDVDFISYVTMLKVFSLASSQVLKIISITLKKEEEEISALPMDEGLKIAIIIAKQNWEIISKNVLGLLPSVAEEKEETEKMEKMEKKTESLDEKSQTQ